MTKRELEILKPFAMFAKSITGNPFLVNMPDNMKLADHTYAPTLGELKRALEIMPDVELDSPAKPELGNGKNKRRQSKSTDKKRR